MSFWSCLRAQVNFAMDASLCIKWQLPLHLPVCDKSNTGLYWGNAPIAKPAYTQKQTSYKEMQAKEGDERPKG